MADVVHPGSWLGDSVEEFKKLPTWAKVGVAGVGIVVVYLGFRAYQNRGNSGNSQATSLPATSNPAGASSPFPMVGNSPLLPANVNPIYDPSGNLAGYQTAGGTSATPPTSVGSTPNPPGSSGSAGSSSGSSSGSSNPVTAVTQYFARARMGSASNAGVGIRSTPGGPTVGNVPYGSAITPTGAAVSGPSNNPVTKGVANSNQWIPVQGGYISAADVSSGSNSSPAVNKQTTTSSQTSSVKPGTTSATGGGFESWQSRIRGLRTYTPQVGDNMNEVAAKLGLKGGWQAFGVSSFEHGVPIAIPSQPSMPNPPAMPSIQGMPGMPNVQQNSQGQSVSMPGINVHQSDQGQAIQLNSQQFNQVRRI